MVSHPMKKIWAIVCVIGFTAFWTFGFLALSEVFGERDVNAINFVLCVVGLVAGLVGRFRVEAMTPPMHGRRAAARARLEEEYKESLG